MPGAGCLSHLVLLLLQVLLLLLVLLLLVLLLLVLLLSASFCCRLLLSFAVLGAAVRLTGWCCGLWGPPAAAWCCSTMLIQLLLRCIHLGSLVHPPCNFILFHPESWWLFSPHPCASGGKRDGERGIGGGGGVRHYLWRPHSLYTAKTLETDGCMGLPW